MLIISSEKGYWNVENKVWVKEREEATLFPSTNFQLNFQNVSEVKWEEK